MLKQSCPCCGKKMSVFNYLFRTKKIDNSLVIQCKYCHKKIIAERVFGSKANMVSIFFFISAFFIAPQLLFQDIYDYIILLIVFVTPFIYADYMSMSMKCSDEKGKE